jgi:hypothetical protein
LASGLINTSRPIGASVGVAILIAIVETSTQAPRSHPEAFDSGIRLALAGATLLCLSATVASVVFIKNKDQSQATNRQQA